MNMRTVGESGDKATRYETTSGQVRIGQDVRLPLTHTVVLVKLDKKRKWRRQKN